MVAEPRLKKVWAAVRKPLRGFCKLMNFHPTFQQAELVDAVQDIADRFRAEVEPYLVAAERWEAKGNHQKAQELNEKAVAMVGDITRRIAVRSGQGPGKCLAGSSRIMTSRGIFTIDELMERKAQGRSLRVLGLHEESGTLAYEQADVFESGEKFCVEVRLKEGQQIQASTDHPIYTSKGWVKAGELRKGMLVAVPHGQPVPYVRGGCDIGHLLAAALLAGRLRGSTTTGTVRWTLGPHYWQFDALETVLITAGIDHQTKQLASGGTSVTARASDVSKALQRYFDTDRPKPWHDRAHPRLWQLGPEQLRDAVGLFWAIVAGHEGRVSCTLRIAPEVKRDVILWLGSAGVQVAETGHRLKVTSPASCATLAGAMWEDAYEVAEALTEHAKASYAFHRDLVMVPAEEWLDMCQQTGLCKPVADTLGLTRRAACVNRNPLAALAEDAPPCKAFDRLHSPLRWVPVESVSSLGVLPVYDLEVPACQSFVADGMIVHNTTTGCIIVLWWVLQWPGARVVLTAPKMQQCKDVFLAELERVLDRGHPYVKRLIEINNTQFGVMGRRPKYWGLISVTASNPDNARGQHGKYMMIHVEEASGVPREIIEILKGTLSNPLSLLCLVGNPSTRDSAFFDCFNVNADQWLKLHWNGEETPPSSWFNPARNQELAEEFGRDSDVYRVAVLGEFPKIDGDAIFSEEDLLACTNPALIMPAARAGSRRGFGLDIARFGGDELVWFRIKGNAVAGWKVMHRVDPSVLLKDAMQEQDAVGWSDEECRYIIDADGIGQGVVNQLYEAHRNVYEFHSNSRSTKPHIYANLITQAWFELAKLVRARAVYLEYDRQLFRQLTSRKYKFEAQKGRPQVLRIESKDDYKTRTKMPSPDRADALVMSFLDIEGTQVTDLGSRGGSMAGQSIRGK